MIFNYNGNSSKSGIYEIRNRLSGKSYLGQAKRFKERWKNHSLNLRNGKHENSHLQLSFFKYVEKVNVDDFLEFHILEIMENSTKRERLLREEFWIDQYLKNGYKLYNKKLKPTLEESVSDCWSHTPEVTRKKMSLSRKGRKAWNKGIKISEEHRQNIKKARAKQVVQHSPETRKKLSEAARRVINHSGRFKPGWRKAKLNSNS